jgi:hypothetical protein
MAADEQDVVEVARDGLQIVMAGDEEAAFGGEFFEKAAQILLRGLVEAGERFVEEQNVGFLRQRTGDEGALLLAAGEGADLAVLEIAQLHAGERALDDLGVVTRILPPPAEIRITAHLDEAAHGDGEVPVDVATLRQVGEFVAAAGERFAAPEDLAAVCGDESGEGFEQRALARAVRADEGHAAAAFGGEADLFERPHFLILHAQIDDFEPVMLRVLATAAPADVLLGFVMRGSAHFQEKVMTSSRLPAEDQRVSLRASRPSGSISSVRAVSGVFSGQVALRKTSTPSLVEGSTGIEFER